MTRPSGSARSIAVSYGEAGDIDLFGPARGRRGTWLEVWEALRFLR